MPKSIRSECDQFVEKYADLVISLLAQELDPDEVCRELKLCDATAIEAARSKLLFILVKNKLSKLKTIKNYEEAREKLIQKYLLE